MQRVALHKFVRVYRFIERGQRFNLGSRQREMDEVNRDRIDQFGEGRFALAEGGKVEPQRHARACADDRMAQVPDARGLVAIVLRKRSERRLQVGVFGSGFQ